VSGSLVDGSLCRVGYHRAPLDFTPLDLYGFSHRFDDVDQRFRTLYVAEFEVTGLREVLADFGRIWLHVNAISSVMGLRPPMIFRSRM